MGDLVKLGDCKQGDWVRLQSGELAIVGLSGDDDTGVDLYLDIYSEGIHRVLSSRSWVEPMCRAAKPTQEHERKEAPALQAEGKADSTRDALVAAVLAWRIPLRGDSIEVLNSARGLIDAVKAYRAAHLESERVE